MDDSDHSKSRRLLSSVTGYLPDGWWLPVVRGPLRGCRWLASAGDSSRWIGDYGYHAQAYVRAVVSRAEVIYDVGAGRGFFTLLFSRLVEDAGKVVSFEPAPGRLTVLRQHIAINGMENVTVNDTAVADYVGPGRLRQWEGRGSGGRLAPEDEGEDGGEGVEVEVTTLEKVASTLRRPPTFIRINAPGSELAVLEGARELLHERHPVVLFGAETKESVQECRSLLHGEGYQLRPLGPSGTEGGWEFAAEPVAEGEG